MEHMVYTGPGHIVEEVMKYFPSQEYIRIVDCGAGTGLAGEKVGPQVKRIVVMTHLYWWHRDNLWCESGDKVDIMKILGFQCTGNVHLTVKPVCNDHL